MHVDEVHTDAALVRRLLERQFPDWAALPIVPIEPTGTDNALYRLGDDRVVRMPRIHWAAGGVEKEQRWLPKLAPSLPQPIPVPLAMGEPGEGYPWRWSVCRWLPGRDATREPLDLAAAALDLARFLRALRAIDASEGPPPGRHNAFRGVPLAVRDASTRRSLEQLGGALAGERAINAWRTALEAPEWRHGGVWIHGDLYPANLLGAQRRISAVIDFGCVGVGDPACDMLVAWSLLDERTRPTFRDVLGVDLATWARGRGWALSAAVNALAYYSDDTNPVLVASARRMLDQVLSDGAH